MESIKIGSVKSGNSEIVVGKFLAKDGKERVDIRLFVTASTEGGYSGPTRNGLAIRIRNTPSQENRGAYR